MNKEGYDQIDEVLKRGLQALSPEAFEAVANETGALILDTRKPEVFAESFIPNAVNIGIDGSFAPWVGTLIPDVKQPILLVTDKGREEEVVTRLARVGYDYAMGYLEGGLEAWKSAGKEIDTIESISAAELALRLKKEALKVLDVRKPTEYETGHMENATNVPLDYLNDHMAEMNKDSKLYLYCAGGYRSMIAASILKARGFDKLVNVEGGFKAIVAADIPCSAGTYTCKSGN
jgi:rhodanese-related sulfurtransferase